MIYEADKQRQLADEQPARAQQTEDKSTRAVERATNWAWSTNRSPYDWMDSHAPFAGLD